MLLESLDDMMFGGIKLQVCNSLIFAGIGFLKYEILESYLSYIIIFVSVLCNIFIIFDCMREFHISLKKIFLPVSVIGLYLIVELILCVFKVDEYITFYPFGLMGMYVIVIMPWQQKKMKTLKKALLEVASQLGEDNPGVFKEETYDALEQITIPNKKVIRELDRVLEAIPEERITFELQEAVIYFLSCGFIPWLFFEGLMIGFMIVLVLLIL